MSSLSQPGLAVTVGLAPTSSGPGRGLDGPVSLAGINAPLQTNTLLDTDGVGADHPASSSGSQGIGVGVGPVASRWIPRPSGTSSNASVGFHWGVSPAYAANTQAFDERNLEVPQPRGADLIAEALPFAHESLENALEDFVNQLGELDLGLRSAQGPAPIVVFSAAVLTSAASAELARRYMQRRQVRNRGVVAINPHGRQHTLGFPELPGSWSERRA